GIPVLRPLVGTAERGFTDFRREHVEPDGVGGLSPDAIAALSPDVVARKLNVPVATALQQLTQRLTAPRRELTIAHRPLPPVTTWNVRSGTIDLGRIAARTVFDVVTAALPDRLEIQPGRAEALGQLLVGVGNANIPELSQRAKDSLGRIADRNTPRLVTPITPVRPTTPVVPVRPVTPVPPISAI